MRHQGGTGAARAANAGSLRLDLAERCFGAADGAFALQRDDARRRRAAFHDIGGAFGDIADRHRVDMATIGCSRRHRTVDDGPDLSEIYKDVSDHDISSCAGG